MRQFSKAQNAYMIAKAAFEAARKLSQDYDRLMDAECEKLGIPTPYGILPDGHPMWVKAQKLLDTENRFRDLMYQAAYNLFDWATETALAVKGTDKQKAEIREMVCKVKKMAFVEKHFEELVDLSMRLAA